MQNHVHTCQVIGAGIGAKIGFGIGSSIGLGLAIGGGPISAPASYLGYTGGGVIGATIGGFLGGKIGGKLGEYFDDECAGQLNCNEEIIPADPENEMCISPELQMCTAKRESTGCS